MARKATKAESRLDAQEHLLVQPVSSDLVADPFQCRISHSLRQRIEPQLCSVWFRVVVSKFVLSLFTESLFGLDTLSHKAIPYSTPNMCLF